MPSGVLFSLAAYLLYSCCDAIIKGFGSNFSPFEIAFWTALFIAWQMLGLPWGV